MEIAAIFKAWKNVIKMSLNELQKAEYEILKLFAKVCDEHQLNYCLTAGSLLGAVRHEGFIPWDDDIDVAMPRADYDRLCRIAKNVFPEAYFWQDENTEALYPFPFAKLRKYGTLAVEARFDGRCIHQGIGIDIFPLDVRPDEDRLAERLFRLEKLFVHIVNLKADPTMKCGYNKLISKLLVQMMTLLPISIIKWIRRKIRIWGSRKGSGRMIITTGGAHSCSRESYEAEWFRSIVDLPFEDSRFHCPREWHKVLTNMYGDYLKPVGMDGSEQHFSYYSTEKHS